MINSKMIKNKNMLLLGVACLVIFLFTAVFPVYHVADWLGQDEIVTVITDYLDESQKVARHDLGKLSELKALLSMIQSSSVGVSFFVDIQVGVGQLMASFSKLVSDAIEAAVLAISTIEVIKFTISFSEAVTPFLFLVVLIAGACYGLIHGFSSGVNQYAVICDRFVKLALALFFVLHLLLPYSLYGAALFSQHLVADSKTENRSVIHNLHHNMSATHKKVGLKDRAENAIHTFEKVVLDLPHKVEAMAIYHTRHMAISLFEFIILPILLFTLSIAAIWWVIRSSGIRKVNRV